MKKEEQIKERKISLIDAKRANHVGIIINFKEKI